MKLTEKKKLILINIVCLVALTVILWPLLLLAKYDYPTADDWSFGKYMYRAMQAGEGLSGVFHAISETLSQNVWEARFSILILSALQPAAFGEHFYRITPYLMIGSVIVSQLLLIRECIGGQEKENRLLVLPIGIPMAIFQILYCTNPEESFYWYNGSVNYTFVYSLSLILLVLYLEIGICKISKAKRAVFTILACLLAVLVGGNNFLPVFLRCVCCFVCRSSFDLQKGCFPENLDRDAAGDRKRPCLHNIPADIQQTECKFWRRNNELSTYGNLAVFGTNFYEYYQLDESESPVDVIGSVSLPLESGKQYELRIPFPRTVYSTVLWCIFLSGNGHNLRGRYHGWRQTGSYPLVFLCIVDGRQCTVLVRLDRQTRCNCRKGRESRSTGGKIPFAL